MRKTNLSDKLNVLIAICDDEKSEDLNQYLSDKKLKNGLIFMGKGTAESESAEMFGFGLSDKNILALLVKESSQEKIMREITDLLGIETDSFGLTMLLETSSASSTILDMVGIDIL